MILVSSLDRIVIAYLGISTFGYADEIESSHSLLLFKKSCFLNLWVDIFQRVDKSKKVLDLRIGALPAVERAGGDKTQICFCHFPLDGLQGKIFCAEVEDLRSNAVCLKQNDGSEKIIALKRNGEIAVLDAKNRELDKFRIPYGATVVVADGKKVKAGDLLFQWDPHRMPILAEVGGMIQFVDIVEGETIRFEEERKGQIGRPVVIEHKGDKHPQIIIEDKKLIMVDK